MRIFKTGEYSNKRRHSCKKMVLSAGMALMLAATPVTAMAGQVYGSNTGVTSANSVMNNIAAGLSMSNKIDVSTLKNNKKVGGDDITLDNDLTDWKNVTERKALSDKVSSWKAVISADYSTLYISYEGTAQSEWDYGYTGQQNLVDITYATGLSDSTNHIQFVAWNGGAQVKNGWYGDIEGAKMVTVNEAHQNTAGPYTVEASIPMNFFTEGNFKITFAGVTVDLADIEVLDGSAIKEDTTEAVYEGITIDGSFKDWDAVARYNAACPNEAHKDCLSKAAMVFDGDYVYIYLKDGATGSAYGAGTHSNGRDSIKTDLGRELVFQLTQDGQVNGIDGVLCQHVGRQWEIAVPKDKLPIYNKTISFGLYLSEPFVKDVANLKDDGSNDSSDGNYDIAYDGLYGDWNKYPHTTIQYATPGTHEHVADASAAIYCDGTQLFGHVETPMQAHLTEAGGELTQAITIKFNDNWSQVFYPRMETVDSDGNINWNSQKGGLSEGTYEFYIFSTDAWHTSANINSTNEADTCYGKMMVTIGSDKDECEFIIDLKKVADKLGCDVSDFKQIDAQFGRLGQQWVTTAGASTGAWLGLCICVLITVGVLVYQKKKGSNQVTE